MHEPMVDDDGVRHEPSPQPHGGDAVRCAGCGYRWPCPIVRMQPEPMLDGGEMVADLVDVGWSIYRRLPPGADYVPPGGVVVAVEHADDPNELPRSYRVVEWRAGRPEFVSFVPGEFDPLLSSPPNSSSVRSTARRLCALVGREKGTVTPTEWEWLTAAHALMSSIA